MAVATRDTEIGYELPSLSKTAVMRMAGEGRTDWDPEKWHDNIHEDKYAQRWGYKGGLVEGDIVFEHIIEGLIDFFGEGWYRSGRITVKVCNPTYAGDKLKTGARVREKVIEGSKVRIVLDVAIEKEGGQKVIVGTASALVD